MSFEFRIKKVTNKDWMCALHPFRYYTQRKVTLGRLYFWFTLDWAYSEWTAKKLIEVRISEIENKRKKKTTEYISYP